MRCLLACRVKEDGHYSPMAESSAPLGTLETSSVLVMLPPSLFAFCWPTKGESYRQDQDDDNGSKDIDEVVQTKKKKRHKV